MSEAGQDVRARAGDATPGSHGPAERLFIAVPWLGRWQTVAALYAALALAASLQRALGAGFTDFDIFRQSFIHLVSGSSLYLPYPAEQGDLFKYSPTFALFMAPFWVLPRWMSLPIWTFLNAFVPFLAVRRLALSDRAQAFMLWFAAIDLLISLQNTESNGIVAGLMIGTFAAFERRRPILAALLVCLAFYLKIFGVAVAILFVLYPGKKLFLAACAALALALGLLPALVIGLEGLLFQYQGWHRLLNRDQFANGLSLIGMVNNWLHLRLPNFWMQLVGAAVLAAPLLRKEAWTDFSWRLRFLSTMLIWVVIFNHKAESPTFVIAMFGIALWGVVEPPSLARSIVLGLSFAATSLSGTDLFPSSVRQTILRPLAIKAIPSVFLWLHNTWRLAIGHRAAETDGRPDALPRV